MTAAAAPARFTIRYDDASHKYWIDDDEVPSVTGILESVIPKPAIGWWSYRVGMAAMAKGVQEGWISYPVLQTVDIAAVIEGIPPKGQEYFRTTGAPKTRKVPKTLLEGPCLDNQFHPNSIKSERGDQGTLIHEAITKMGLEGELPSLGDHEEEDRGYLQAFAKWWVEQEPDFLEQEVIVASKRLMYAGRLDLICGLGDKRAMVDFKTSKAIRESHHLQMNLYEPAYYECGGDPLDRLCVVNLRKDGTYEMVDSVGTPEMVVPALNWATQMRAFTKRFEERHGRTA